MKILLLAPQPFFQNRGTPIAVRLMAETLEPGTRRLAVESAALELLGDDLLESLAEAVGLTAAKLEKMLADARDELRITQEDKKRVRGMLNDARGFFLKATGTDKAMDRLEKEWDKRFGKKKAPARKKTTRKKAASKKKATTKKKVSRRTSAAKKKPVRGDRLSLACVSSGRLMWWTTYLTRRASQHASGSRVSSVSPSIPPISSPCSVASCRSRLG